MGYEHGALCWRRASTECRGVAPSTRPFQRGRAAGALNASAGGGRAAELEAECAALRVRVDAGARDGGGVLAAAAVEGLQRALADGKAALLVRAAD
jgi:hypothetical protein